MASRTGVSGLPAGSIKYCQGCAAELHVTAVSCPYCGAVLIQPREQKSRALAVVLAILLGGLGLHKFYLGRIGWGVVYLVFCWTFIPALLGLAEGVVYACMGDQGFHEKYG